MGFYTWRTQYYPPKPTFTEKELPSQRGRVFLVTGGNGGIGFELCKILYNAGGTVYFTARSEDRALKAIELIKSAATSTTEAGKLHYLHLALDDLASVKACASAFAAQESKLDVLWNNAGASALTLPDGSKTKQGLESFIGINCVGPVLLTQLLLPRLQAAAQDPDTPTPRVVWSSSHLGERLGHRGGMDFTVLDAGGARDQMQDYGISKMGNWLLAHELAVRHPELISVTANPGNLDTEGYRGAPKLVRAVLSKMVLHDIRFGAYTELFAGLSPAVGKEQSGAYLIPWGRVYDDKINTRSDVLKALKKKEDGGQDIGRQFWEWCEKHTKDFM